MNATSSQHSNLIFQMSTPLLLKVRIFTWVIGAILLFRLFSISPGIPISILSSPPPGVQKLTRTLQANPNHAYAHQQLALLAYKNEKIEAAKEHALKALGNNPSSGLAMTILMLVFDKEKKTERANQAALLAAHLWPSHDESMWFHAEHWLKNKDIEKAMSAWNVILSQQSMRPNGEDFSTGIAAQALFPLLDSLAQHEDSTHLFQPYHANPPPWWNNFFQHMTTQPDSLVAVERFYQQALLNGNTSPVNRKHYLDNLVRGNQWPKAHEMWKNGLSEEKQNLAGLIYDGGFESTYINDQFNWILTDKNNIQVYFDIYSRTEKAKSLRIAFNRWTDDYWGYIHQLLVLPPGNYTVHFQTRANLDSFKGLKWLIGCYQHETKITTLLARSRALNGDFDWRKEQFTLTIPDDIACTAQRLYLVTVGGNSTGNRMRGDIWFDDFKIIKSQ